MKTKDETEQLASTSVEGLNRKHPTAYVGKPDEESSRSPAEAKHKHQQHQQQVRNITVDTDGMDAGADWPSV